MRKGCQNILPQVCFKRPGRLLGVLNAKLDFPTAACVELRIACNTSFASQVLICEIRRGQLSDEGTHAVVAFRVPDNSAFVARST